MRVRILGVPVDTVNTGDALEYINNLIQNNKKGNYILAVNAEKIMTLQKDSFLKTFYENAALILPDGIGVTIAVKWILGLKIRRVAGADLMQNICEEAVKRGSKIFIFGGKEEINKTAVEKINLAYPGICIVGRCDGYIDEDKMKDLIDKINKSKADILFIALGSPKQERWIQKYLHKTNTKICQGIGGTLDVISGRAKRAPRPIQRIGLEWLYRLFNEPERIRRQIIYPMFLFRVIMEKLKISKNY